MHSLNHSVDAIHCVIQNNLLVVGLTMLAQLDSLEFFVADSQTLNVVSNLAGNAQTGS